ncbi:MAG: sigma-54-dependent Fis family transcriptional regulator [Candidatus Rokubacteria bacterium]|nr:sigma-54-dependent Fis family transcriptional regulator [Candidatus Rokubacteria bacterium]
MAPEPAKGERPVVLTVDDELGVRESIRQILQDECNILEATEGRSALAQLQSREVDLVLLDVRLPGESGIEILERIKALEDSLEVILVTAVKDVRTAVEAIKRGAYDYVTKPFDVDEMLALVRRALDKRALQREVLYLRSELARAHGFDQIVGRHPEMVRIYERIAQVAETNATVLITGESGTGKELIARAIHRQGPRRERPYVAVNLAAIPEPLLESELFGHEKGAFTGAYQKKLGRFELAHGGSLFLDEVGTLRVDLQAKLLRVLQEREVERIGGNRSVKVDIRVIAATNANLKQAVKDRTFREDLYYRLNVVPLAVPPLRERREDIPLLVDHFVKKYNREFGKAVRGISPGALPVLLDYDWPGNVRELENIIERSVALATAPVIHLRDLPLDLALPDAGARSEEPGLSLKEARGRFERQFILRTLERVDWNQSRAARLLGLHRNTLTAKLAGWGLRRRDSGAVADAP